VSPRTARSAGTSLVDPPRRLPAARAPALLLVESISGKGGAAAALLAHFPEGALGAGVFEAAAANASDMDQEDGARVLAIARIVAPSIAGCPFCIDMKAASGSALEGALVLGKVLLPRMSSVHAARTADEAEASSEL
jgi:hypothetical protein